MLYIILLAVAPFEDLENNQFFLPITKLLIARSACYPHIRIISFIRRLFLSLPF
jgi:hypothetical protein